MKKFFKKIAFTLISMQLILSNSMISVNASENILESLTQDFSSLRFIGSQNIDTDNVQYNSSTFDTATSSYPSKYDLRELGLVTTTESQGGYGLCWTFATTQSAMSRLIERNPFVNLSEWHLGYFTYNGDTPMDMYNASSTKTGFYNKGGSASFSTATLSRWNGFVSESVAPYGSGDLDNSLNYASEYHLTDALCMNSALNDNITYTTYGDAIKSMILNGNSVMASMYYNSSKYYSSESHSYYCGEPVTNNHGVTIVGWDDDFYSYDGLNDKPTSKGAWLIKNTYGYQFGEYGYFWLSYENTLYSDITSFIATSNENYSTNYSIDNYGWTTSINSLTTEKNNKHTDYAGNIFTAINNEDLSAVGIYTTDYDTEYTIYIYKNLTDDSSPIGELVESFSGIQPYSGYHTISLETPIPLETGEKFSVVVKYKNPNYTSTVAVESAVTFFNVVDGEVQISQYNVLEDTLLSHNSPNESFVSNDGKSWKSTRGVSGIISIYDTAFDYQNSFDINSLSDGYYATSVLGNACIKAFTNPHDKVYFSQYGGNLYLGETIELSNPNEDAIIYYTLDGSTPTLDSDIYTEPITFNGEDVTISARVYIDGVLGETYIEEFTQLNSVITSLCIKEVTDSNIIFNTVSVSDGNSPNTDLVYTCDNSTNILNLFPISCGEITINGESVTSGHETEITIGDSSSTVIPILVSKEGCIPTEYTLTINKKVPIPITYDYLDIITLKKYLLNTSDSVSFSDVLMYDFNNDNSINNIDLIILKNKVLSTD